MSGLFAEKPGVLERLASAMGSSDLSPDPEQLRPVDMITALAYTQTNPGAEEHGELETARIDPGTELGGVLVRIKYANDRALGARAKLLLVAWVRNQRAFRNWRRSAGFDDTVDRFVRQGLAEWLFPVCVSCEGRGMLGLDRGAIVERRVRCRRCAGKGFGLFVSRKSKLRAPLHRDCSTCGGKGMVTISRVRQSKPEQCYSCRGTGQRRVGDAERALALGVDVRVYERYWAKRFSWLAAGLDGIDKLERSCLQSVLSGGIKRS